MMIGDEQTYYKINPNYKYIKIKIYYLSIFSTGMNIRILSIHGIGFGN
jgi:hypothetical protein